MRLLTTRSFNVLLVLGLLLSLGPVAVSRAQEATPAATPTAVAWEPCGEDAPGWECATLSPSPSTTLTPTAPISI